jgi:hypothetical protein
MRQAEQQGKAQHGDADRGDQRSSAKQPALAGSVLDGGYG